MIAMQSYNGFGRLRVQKFRLTFINAGMGWGLERCMMNFFEKILWLIIASLKLGARTKIFLPRRISELKPGAQTNLMGIRED